MRINIINHTGRKMMLRRNVRYHERRQEAFLQHMLGHATDDLLDEISDHLGDPNGA